MEYEAAEMGEVYSWHKIQIHQTASSSSSQLGNTIHLIYASLQRVDCRE